MVAESPNLYIANLLKEQQESKDFVRCICMDNNQKRGRAELLQKNWKTILYLLDEAQFVDADTPPKLDLRMEELAKKKSDHPAVIILLQERIRSTVWLSKGLLPVIPRQPVYRFISVGKK